MKGVSLESQLMKWESFYKQKGIPEPIYQVYLEYARPLFEKDLPVIFDFEHLVALLGLNRKFVAAVVNHPESFYREFEIPKRSGGKRNILAPYPSLKYVQAWIADNILSHIKISGCAHGFVPQRSILTNVKLHLSNDYLLKLDLKDFFPSIPIKYVINVFKSQGYSFRVSSYLATICCYDGYLPQGAPTSPALSNIIAHHMDNRLKKLARKTGNKYTRYADDLAFSGKKISFKLVDIIKHIIEDCGFQLNESKIRLYNNNGSKILTGISLSNGTPSLPREYKRNLKQELYYIQKYGFIAHVQRSRIRNPRYLESLLGKVNYWLMVEPENEFAQTAHQHISQLYKQKMNV